MSGLDCSRKEKGKKERRRARGEEKKLLTPKKVGAGVVVVVGGGEGGDLWGTFITTQRCPGETKEEGRRQNIPFPLPLLLPLQKQHGGWRALSRGGGVFKEGGINNM